MKKKFERIIWGKQNDGFVSISALHDRLVSGSVIERSADQYGHLSDC